MILDATGILVKVGDDEYFVSPERGVKIHKEILQKNMGDVQAIIFEDEKGERYQGGYDVVVELDREDFTDVNGLVEHYGMLKMLRDKEREYYSLYECLQHIGLYAQDGDLSYKQRVVKIFKILKNNFQYILDTIRVPESRIDHEVYKEEKEYNGDDNLLKEWEEDK